MKKTTILILLFCFGIFISISNAQTGNTCAESIALAVGAPSVCSNTVVTIDGTITDSGIADPGCADYAGSDFWFQITMPASGGVQLLTSASDNSIEDTGIAVYSGTDCNNLVLISCNDDISGTNTFSRMNVAHTPGQTLYIRVWEWGGSTGSGSFNICATEITPPPVAANDDCITAETLSLGATCIAVIGSNNATNSEDLDPTIPGTGCAAYGGRDVWYKVVVPASGQIILETSEDDLSISDGGMAIYSGSCDSNGLTLVDCDDSSNSNTIYDFERIELTNRTEGEQLFIRVWAFDNAELGTFEICAIDPEPLSISNATISDFKMYPNPIVNSGTLNMKLNNLFNSDINILIYNIEGRQVFTKSTNALDGNLSMNINLPASGVYFVKVIAKELIITKKLVVY